MNTSTQPVSWWRAAFALLLSAISLPAFAQVPTCGSSGGGLVYSLQGTTIMNFDPTQPVSGTNPVANTITAPPGAIGLAVANNINGPGPSPTFYVVDGSTYSYWDGTTWVNTGHTSGAVNPGGGGLYIYSLIGGTGEVYKYDGTGNATLLVTISSFASGGPYDLAADNCGNFYILKMTTTPYLQKYDPSGALIASWTVTGATSIASGGGMAIIGNQVYCSNTGGFWVGTMSSMSGGNVSFVLQPGVPLSPSDFGSCPLGTGGFVKASPDTSYYCGTGPGVPISVIGGTPSSITWSVLSGPAVITGSGATITVTTTGTSKIVMDATITNPCGSGNVSGKDTVTVVMPTATIDAGVNDTFFGCGDYIDTLHGSLTNNQLWLSYNLDWTPTPYVQSGGNTLNPVVNPAADGWFYLTATTDANKGSCSWRDSVYIKTIDADVTGKFGMDVHLGCDEDTVLFLDSSTTKLTALKYKWMFGDNGGFDTVQKTSHIYKKQSIYQVIQYIDNGYCKDTVIHSVDLNHPLHAIFSFDDTRLCQGDTIEFDGSGSIISLPVTPPKYAWYFSDDTRDSVAKPRHSFAEAKSYFVRLIVTDSLNCTDTIVHTVDNIIPLPIIEAGPDDTTICMGEKLYLPLGISAHGNEWIWSDGTTEPRKIVSKAGTYIVQLYNECGFRADTVKVNFKNCSVYVPNVFTPNGDGKNDIMHILGNMFDVTDCEFAIFNRWGTRMFYTSDHNQGWDGTYKGEPQDAGTYYYIVKYKMHGEVMDMKGDILLVR